MSLYPQKAVLSETVYVQSKLFTQALTVLQKHACGACDIFQFSSYGRESDQQSIYLLVHLSKEKNILTSYASAFKSQLKT